MFSPVGLHEDAINVLECDGACLFTNDFDEGAQTEVTRTSEQAFTRSDDESQGVIGEGVVSQSDTIELVEDEGLGELRRQWF